MKNKKFDLKKYRTKGVKIFSGRERGKLVRENMKLDELDLETVIIEIVFPADILTMTTSFFLGLFGKSVRASGSENLFREKYMISGTEQILLDTTDGIEIALKETSPLEDTGLE